MVLDNAAIALLRKGKCMSRWCCAQCLFLNIPRRYYSSAGDLSKDAAFVSLSLYASLEVVLNPVI